MCSSDLDINFLSLLYLALPPPPPLATAPSFHPRPWHLRLPCSEKSREGLCQPPNRHNSKKKTMQKNLQMYGKYRIVKMKVEEHGGNPS